MKQLMRILIIILSAIVAFSVVAKKSANPIQENTQQKEINIITPIQTNEEQNIKTQPETIPQISAQESTQLTIQEIQHNQIDVPSTFNLTVPFYPQAPDGNRKLPRQETCEEASIVLAAYYIKGEKLTKTQFTNDILNLIQRENTTFGDYKHTTVDQTVDMYNDFYGDGSAKIIENPSIEDIKQEIAQGHIVVAPFAGRLLGNPHFSGSGPRYHMLVIKGYDEKYFYTNDVGTIHGANYPYAYETILQANHDYNDQDMTQGAKRMIVIEK